MWEERINPHTGERVWILEKQLIIARTVSQEGSKGTALEFFSLWVPNQYFGNGMRLNGMEGQ